MSVFHLLENNRTYLNLSPKGEPQLGKRGLYGSIGGRDVKTSELAMLWVLNFSDGGHNLLDIAERSGMAFGLLAEAAQALSAKGLLREVQ
jgi:aminopeptidase-like protein